MKFLHLSLILVLTVTSVVAQPKKPAVNAKRNAFVTKLMAKMTLEEKVGQLNLPSVGFDVTGPVVSQDVEAKIQSTEKEIAKLKELAK